MKYIKKFKHEEEFNAFKDSDKYVTPNVSYIHGVEKSKLRRNVKFKIQDKEYNAGDGMTWEEWIGHDNHAHYNDDFFTFRNGEVINREALNVYETIGNSETFNKKIIPQNMYFASTDIKLLEHKTLYYTSSDNNIIAINNTGNFIAGNVISHTYENGVGCVIFEKDITQIGSSAFQNCTTLTSITIPNSVTSIGESAFNGCTGLKTITIPDSVVSIGGSAFRGCSGLTGELVIPDSVTSINWNAFMSCTGLTALRLPNNLQSGGNYIFYGCSGLTGTIVIPHGWTTIPQHMFGFCKKLTEISIPNTVTSIGKDAFYNCTGLTGELTIPDSVVTIESNAFSGCSGLTSIRFSNNLQSIEDSAFQSCNGLVDIVIPDSVTVFNGAPFEACRGLESVIIGNGIKKLGQYCFRYCSNLHTVVLPDTLTVIGGSAFNSCSKLTNINLPNSLIKIGYEAFSSCYSLTGELVLPAKLQFLGTNAFYNCSRISSVRILSDTLTIGYDYDSKTGYTKNPFSWCSGITEFISNYSYFDNSTLIINNELIAVAQASSLSELVIPDGVVRVADRAAYSCKNLKRLVLPNTLTTIGSYAFDYSGITYELDIPASVLEIQYQVFSHTPLQKVNIHGVVPCSITSSSFDSDVNFYVVDNFIDLYKEQWSSYKDRIFGNGTNITNTTTFIYTTTDGQIITPANYVIVNNEYQNGSGTLEVLGTINAINKEFNLPNLESLIIPDGVTYISSKAFENCTTIKSITIPDSVISIGERAFYGCSNLTGTINIPAGTTHIEPYTFYNCSGLTGELTIPDSVVKIDGYAFKGCSGFAGTLTISNSLTQIGSKDDSSDGNIFSDCSGITNIIFPNNLTTVGYSAFSGCTGLTNVVIPESVTEFAGSVFSDCTNLTSLTLPQHLNDLGQMQRYSVQHITIPNGVTKLQGMHFYNCTNLKSITLPNTLNSIGSSAFSGCTNLERVNISDINAWCQIEFNGNNTNPIYHSKNLYLNGELLTNLVIPEGVTEINAYAFYNCQSLQSVTLPVSLQTIGIQAFYGCKNLTNINISSNLKTINSEAFNGCTNLKRVNISDISAWCQINSSGASANPLYYAKNLYLNGELLTNLVIPEGTTRINEYAFYNCSGLTGDINLPNSIASIGQYAFYNCSGLTGELRIPDSVPSIGQFTFYNCSGISGQLIIPDSVISIGQYAFSGCSGLTSITLGKNVNSLGIRVFQSCKNIRAIISNNVTAPAINKDTFAAMTSWNEGGTLFCPASSVGYDNWMTNGLTSQKWELKELYEINSYFDLQIQANDVKNGRQTTTTVYWTCGIEGVNSIDGLPVIKQISGTAISNKFPQNLSETETVEREITFEYQGLTATTTITQGVWGDANYEVLLNDNWEKSTTITNPDEGLYDGVYQSFSNKGVNNTAATMYIDIVGYENFKFYIRSYAESSCDYVMVSQLDKDINNNTSYSDTSLVKAHTHSNQQSGTAISNYTLVEFTGLDEGEHRISVVYRKDSSAASGDDRGYILIPFE